uniref:Uncharacterized protein n=1 Tax=Parascaris equorum TaxID=6256 RepID=A0A914S447_PAREQ
MKTFLKSFLRYSLSASKLISFQAPRVGWMKCHTGSFIL